MASATNNKDQQHPQAKSDREIIERLLQQEATNSNKAELGRLRIRYCGFPGAREMQEQLDKVLQQWQMTEEELFESTRQLHATGQAYKRGGGADGQDDWN